MDEKYSVYSEFDIYKHKQTFINYLEVIIQSDGSVHYAVPSHQEFLINLAIKKLDVNRETLYSMCPKEYMFDVIIWLCSITQCISVWNDHIEYFVVNHDQLSTLRQLKSEGLYRGTVPNKYVRW